MPFALSAFIPTHIMEMRDLSPVFQVAIAFCTAYLALDHFKWSRRLEAIRDDHLQTYKGFTMSLGDAQKDLYERYKKTANVFMTYYRQLLNPHNDLRHIYEDHNPWVKDVMVLLTIMNLGLLLISCFFIWKVNSFACFGWGLPAVIGIMASSYGAYDVHNKVITFKATLHLTSQAYKYLGLQDGSINSTLATAECVLLGFATNVLSSTNNAERETNLNLLIDRYNTYNNSTDIRNFVKKHSVLNSLINKEKYQKRNS